MISPWVVLSLRIGLFGFLKEFRPEDPYITQYLVGPVMNLTETQVNQQVFPVATYCGLVEMVFVFLLTDFLCYKPVIIVNAISGIISQGFLIWGRGLLHMQVMEFFYATMTACEVAYYTYIYAKVSKEHYQAVTSHMRAATLAGRFLSACTGQIGLSYGFLTIPTLNHLTFIGMWFALGCAITLPSMKHSLYFHRRSSLTPSDGQDQTISRCDTEPDGSDHKDSNRKAQLLEHGSVSSPTVRTQDVVSNTGAAPPSKQKAVAGLLWDDFKQAYTNPYILKLCIFVALLTAGFNQMMTYVQLLWVAIGGKQQEAYNGGVEAVYTIISACASLTIGCIKADWRIYGDIVLGGITLLQGFVLVMSAYTESLVFAYATYVIFGILFNSAMIIANSQWAVCLKKDSYGLVYGVNLFVALILQTILTFTVTGEHGFSISIRDQFVVYGGYFIVVGAFFTAKSVFQYIYYLCKC